MNYYKNREFIYLPFKYCYDLLEIIIFYFFKNKCSKVNSLLVHSSRLIFVIAMHWMIETNNIRYNSKTNNYIHLLYYSTRASLYASIGALTVESF